VGLAFAGRGRLELGRGQDRQAEPGGHGLPGGHAQPVAAQQVPDGQVGRGGRLLDLAGDRLQLEQAAGQLGVELAGLVPAAAGGDEALPLDDPVVGQGVEVAQLAAEGGARTVLTMWAASAVVRPWSRRMSSLIRSGRTKGSTARLAGAAPTSSRATPQPARRAWATVASSRAGSPATARSSRTRRRSSIVVGEGWETPGVLMVI